MEDSNNEEEEEIGRETRERWREMLRAVETPEALHPNSDSTFLDRPPAYPGICPIHMRA